MVMAEQLSIFGNSEELKEDFQLEDMEYIDVKYGDIFEVDGHRVMCGDATKKEDVKLLLKNVKIDIIITDPPYNINYQGINDERKILNDKMSDEDFVLFLKKSILDIDTIYIFCSWQYSHLFKKALEELNKSPKAMIIWDKIIPAQNLDKYYKRHEILWYYGKFGGQKTLRGDIWKVQREKNTIHPTMKPIKLITMILEDNKDKKNIYDAFGGSGSTLIGAQLTNRKAYIMELDEKYVEVILNRYTKAFGKKWVKVSE